MSRSLLDELCRRIRENENRAINFEEYMELCLYHPQWGYYMRPGTKIGREGDFYTSASVGSVMGEAIAEVWLRLLSCDGLKGRVAIVEWGGGDGRMAKHILDRWRAAASDLYANVRYDIIEAGPSHREAIRLRLAEHGGRVRVFASEEEWVRERDFRAAVTIGLANEFLDAFPVRRVRVESGVIREIGVAWNEKREALEEVLLPASPEVEAFLQRGGIRLAEGQTAELPLRAVKWVSALSGVLPRPAHLFIIDYGDTADELYAVHRFRGTLMTYRRHVASTDPYEAPGEQDLTAHVDFSAVMRAAEHAGFTVERYETQLSFLLRAGALAMLADAPYGDPFHPVARRNRAVRQMLLSDGMSELFKVLHLTARS